MRIEQVVPYIGVESSGPAWSVPALCSSLSKNGSRVCLHTLGPLPDRAFDFSVCEYPWQTLPFKPLGVSGAMKRGLRDAAHSADIMHNHSLWMMPNIYPGEAVRNTKCKLVTTPRGTMSEYAWSRSRWKKQIMWWLGQHAAIDQTSLFHATCEDELSDIRRLGWHQPVAVIPNGVMLPVLKKKEPMVAHAGGQRILLFLSRIHPKKQVDSLLKVWEVLGQENPDWDLWICGPMDSKYPREMMALSHKLNLDRVYFKGELVGSSKFDAYRMADLFVLPTHSENFGIVVAEALAHGTPAVVTKGAPWSGLNTKQCGWWIDNDEKVLYSTLANAMSLSLSELDQMGQKGRQWMERDFCWDVLAGRMRCAYEWLLYGGTKPDFIYTD